VPTATPTSTLPRGTRRPAHLTLDPEWDLLTVLEYGAVWDGPDPRRTRGIDGDRRVGFLLRAPRRGPVIGFCVCEPHDVDPDGLEDPEIWDGPRFEVPLLGLTGASVGQILLAVRARFEPGEPTTDAMHFHLAIAAGAQGADAETVAGHFQMALEAGEQKARFGLGYTLLEAGDARGGYDHLRRYAELAPHNAWAWRWFGVAAEAAGEPGEAALAYKRARRCTSGGSHETDAEELAAALRERRRRRGAGSGT